MEHEQTHSARVKDYFATLSNAALCDLRIIGKCCTQLCRLMLGPARRRVFEKGPHRDGSNATPMSYKCCPLYRQQRTNGGGSVGPLCANSDLMHCKQTAVGIDAAAPHEVCAPLGRLNRKYGPLARFGHTPPIMRASLPSSTNARHAGHLSTRQGRVRRDNAEGCRRRRSRPRTPPGG